MKYSSITFVHAVGFPRVGANGDEQLRSVDERAGFEVARDGDEVFFSRGGITRSAPWSAVCFATPGLMPIASREASEDRMAKARAAKALKAAMGTVLD